MAQHRSTESSSQTGTGAATGRLIEKGWTVLDAAQHPVGNVTDVNPERGRLTIDGRPEGYGTFELPLDAITRSGDNEVHLRQTVDVSTTAAGGAPRFVDAPAATHPTATTKRTESSTNPSTSATASAGTTSTFGGNPTFSDPSRTTYAASAAPVWIDDDDASGGWSVAKFAAAALTLGGVAAATYFMRQRRKKSTWERFLDISSDYAGSASDFARQQNPAWLGALAAAALPMAYYAWPSSRPTYRQQAQSQFDDLASYLGPYLGGLSSRLPSSPWRQPTMNERWRKRATSAASAAKDSDWSSPSTWNLPVARRRQSDLSEWSEWSMRPDVMVPAGLLAASALAFYMARRKSGRMSMGSRIGDVMTRTPRVIQPDATVADAAALMRQLNIGALPVCDGTRLIGMLTDRDITLRSTADGRDPHLTTVRDVMSSGVAWASEDDPVEAAARIMREHRIRRLPIVNDRHNLVGVVSLGDLAVDVDDDDVSGDTLEEVSRPARPNR